CVQAVFFSVWLLRGPSRCFHHPCPLRRGLCGHSSFHIALHVFPLGYQGHSGMPLCACLHRFHPWLPVQGSLHGICPLRMDTLYGICSPTVDRLVMVHPLAGRCVLISFLCSAPVSNTAELSCTGAKELRKCISSQPSRRYYPDT